MDLRQVMAALCIALAAGGALAQTRIELAPPAALDCLQVPAGQPVEPVYPVDQYKGGVTGRVQAAVTLQGGRTANDIELLTSEGDLAFVGASRQFLRSLSAPCLQRPARRFGWSTTLSSNQIDARCVWAGPRAPEDPAQTDMAKCVRHSGGEKNPRYPPIAQRNDLQGRLFAIMTFSAPDTAPAVELFNRPAAAPFSREVRAWMAELRMPCYSGAPVRTSTLFTFVLDEGAYGFRPLTLSELLSVSKGIGERRLELDTTTMGCPFSLKLTYYQPLRRNAVGEVGGSHPERRPLLDLLAGLELDLSRNALDSVFADTADVAVPCIRLNLNDPKEKTS